MHRRMIARTAYDVHYIALHASLDVHILYFSATTGNRIDFAERLNVNAIEASSVEAGIPTGHDLLLVFKRWVRQKNLQQETIELCFGQRVGALILDRIFGREHTEQRR